MVEAPSGLPAASLDGGAGGGTWSKKPSFSSNITNRAVRLQTSGLAVRASITWAVKAAPWAGLEGPGCSESPARAMM